jgi:hypothetical protein
VPCLGRQVKPDRLDSRAEPFEISRGVVALGDGARRMPEEPIAKLDRHLGGGEPRRETVPRVPEFEGLILVRSREARCLEVAPKMHSRARALALAMLVREHRVIRRRVAAYERAPALRLPRLQCGASD